jgi:hypothetical protein
VWGRPEDQHRKDEEDRAPRKLREPPRRGRQVGKVREQNVQCPCRRKVRQEPRTRCLEMERSHPEGFWEP